MTQHKTTRPTTTTKRKPSRHRKHPILSDDKFDRVYNADKTLNLGETIKRNLADDTNSSDEG